ncbi:MAG: phthiocerol/phthiodiolone dimycocerosyl transferase family protein [Blautia faecis]
MKEGYSNWRKLDNAALAFPLVTGKNDTRVFRFYCELKENVKPELLQAALEKTMEKYPLFQMVLRKGLFWFYLEHRDIRPIVKEEKKPPCSRLYVPDKKNLLFQVSYYEKRINFEVFHALTDGTGAMHFLQELVINYLKKAHPEQNLPSLPVKDTSTPGDQEEDSFSQYYSSDIPGNSEKKPRAVRLPGERLLHEDMHITEIVLPVKELHAKAKEYGVSITILITAMFLCSIHEEIPKSRQNRPIALMVPVNLRNYFPSQSMANFFGWIEVGHDFSQTSDFTEILAHVKEQFAAELVEEKIARHMNSYVRLEKNPVIRAVPLGNKEIFPYAGSKPKL